MRADDKIPDAPKDRTKTRSQDPCGWQTAPIQQVARLRAWNRLWSLLLQEPDGDNKDIVVQRQPGSDEDIET